MSEKGIPQEKAETHYFLKPATVKQLHQFLGMINFYRRFIQGIAQMQITMNDALKRTKAKGRTPVEWTTERKKTFMEVKEPGSCHHAGTPRYSNGVTISHGCIRHYVGSGKQQKMQLSWQPLTFLNKKLSVAQRKYSPYDRELLAIYTAIRHFRHMLKEREFSVLTDHKSLIYFFK